MCALSGTCFVALRISRVLIQPVDSDDSDAGGSYVVISMNTGFLCDAIMLSVVIEVFINFVNS